MTRPAVSIVLPARNAESTIGLAIESCLAQTLPDFEMVVMDHHSTDGTWREMKKYARRDQRIRILKAPEGAGFIKVVNLVWHEAHGDLIARMDADDFAYPARLQYQVKAMTEHPEWAACGTGVRIRKRTTQKLEQADLFGDGGDSGETIFTLPDGGYAEYEKWINSVVAPEDIAAQRFIDSPISNPTSVVRREVLERYSGYADEDWAEDYDFWLRMLEDQLTIGKVDRVLLDWHDGETRATRTQSRYAMDRFHLAKAHYLARLPLVQRYGVVIAGAGPIGKKMARRLIDRAIPVRAFFDINKRRIGDEIHGAKVLNRSEMGKFKGEAVMLGAVGLPGARDNVRSFAIPAGFVEGEDFFCIA